MESKEIVDLQVWRLVFCSTQPEATPSKDNRSKENFIIKIKI